MTMRNTTARHTFAVCAVAAGLLLTAGCKPATGTTSSSNPSGAASASGTLAPTEPGASVGDLSGLPSGFPSYTGDDPACRATANAVESLGPQLGDLSDKSAAATTFANMAQAERDAAPQATTQNVTSAVSILADDYQAIADALNGGSDPNYLKLTKDVVAAVQACASTS
jgi:hypothetical protein